MALRETLVRLKKQQEDAASFESEKPRLRDEWIAAVGSLVEDCKTFLSAFEADGSLTLQEREVTLTEDMLGPYTVPALTIEAGPAKVELTPVGRVVVGSVGRVDLSRQGYPRSGHRLLVLRFQDEDSNTRRWMLRMPVEVGAEAPHSFSNRTRQFDFDFIPFDRNNLEKAIDFLLSL